MNKILSLTRRCVEDYDMIQPGDIIAVGVSGGKDSLVLLTALAELRKFYPVPFQVVAITLDMGAMGQPEDQAKGVQQLIALCRKHKVEWNDKEFPVSQSSPYEFIDLTTGETKDPFDLLDEVERELGIETYAMNWPIGSGKDFQGVYDREKEELIFFTSNTGKRKADKMSVDLYDKQVAELLDSEAKHQQLIEDVELLSAGREMDMEAVRRGQLSPVFFGSALTNFGIEPFLENFLKLTPPPLARTSDQGEVDTFSPDFSAFVFKIQANMNKAHRDRLAFMRICSGKFERDKEYYHIQGKKKMRLSQPQQLMAAEREIVEEAYAGDVIGVFDPGIFAIGDTITVPGKKFSYSGIPTFAPEHFCRVSAKDSMKRKQFVKGTEQIAQEGAIQIFKLPNSGMEEVIVGVVGTLQLDVFQYRMKNEYGVDLRMEMLPYEEIRLIDEYPGDLSDMNLGSDAELLEDYRGRSLLVFSSYWAIDFICRRNPGLTLREIVVEEG